jgi:energy-coupling factor transporter ATP-binding protein EcfA2
MDGSGFKFAISFLEKRGQERYGVDFHIPEKEHRIVYMLLVYFLRQEREAAELGIDLGKGLMLTGPVGCGKTALMMLMKLITPSATSYTMRSCREIVFEANENGFEVIAQYSRYSFNGDGPRAYCFDDLGAEKEMKIYGNSCSIMGEILQSRYDLFISSGMITHMTTNLHVEWIDKMYGTRVRSRLREMMNMVMYPNDAKDKRV